MEYKFIKSALRKAGHIWWGLSEDARKIFANFFEKLAVASAIPVIITPLLTGEIESIWRLLILLICAIIFLTIAVLAVAKKEKK